MSYPHKFYVYADASLEADILALLDEYGVEKGSLPNPANTDTLKYRCTHKDVGEIQALDKAVEDLGAWLVYGRMPESMAEFEEPPSGGPADITEKYLIVDVGAETTDYIYTKDVTLTAAEGVITGYIIKWGVHGTTGTYLPALKLGVGSDIFMETWGGWFGWDTHQEMYATEYSKSVAQVNYFIQGGTNDARFITYHKTLSSGLHTFTIDCNFAYSPPVVQDYLQVWAVYITPVNDMYLQNIATDL